jgi:hypothetical protein
LSSFAALRTAVGTPCHVLPAIVFAQKKG